LRRWARHSPPGYDENALVPLALLRAGEELNKALAHVHVAGHGESAFAGIDQHGAQLIDVGSGLGYLGRGVVGAFWGLFLAERR